MQEFFRGAFPLAIHINEIGQHAFGAEVTGASAFQFLEKLTGGFGGVAVVGKDVLDGIATGFEGGAGSAQTVNLLAQRIDLLALAAQLLFNPLASLGDGLQLHLPLRHVVGQVAFDFRKPLDFHLSHFFFTGGPGAFAVDGGEISVGLGNLIAGAGCFTEQTQNSVAQPFNGVVGLADADLHFVAAAVHFHQTRAGFLHFRIQRGDGGGKLGAFDLVGGEACLQLTGLKFGAGHTLLEAGGFPDLGFQAATGAGGFHVELGELSAVPGEIFFQRVEGLLGRGARGILGCSRGGGFAEFTGCLLQQGGHAGCFCVQGHVTPRQYGAKLRSQFFPKFVVALGFGGLAAEGIDLAVDFFQDIENPRKVLPR